MGVLCQIVEGGEDCFAMRRALELGFLIKLVLLLQLIDDIIVLFLLGNEVPDHSSPGLHSHAGRSTLDDLEGDIGRYYAARYAMARAMKENSVIGGDCEEAKPVLPFELP